MQLTFATDLGQTYTIEIDPQMELENIMALLEVASGIPPAEQNISYEGKDLTDPKKTVSDYGLPDDVMLLIRRRVSAEGMSAEQDAEMMRLQALGNPGLMEQLRETQPELARAAEEGDTARFAQLLSTHMQRQRQAEMELQRNMAALNADPFDIEAQKRIEEAIRQEAVLENLAHAYEYTPEAFGRVTMLYIPVEVNGVKVLAFVDSGAQSTIISPETAEKTGIMRLIDKRWSGIAKGVGTARILGRVHSAPMRVADLYLPCAFTVMEGRDVDLLFGLDMLKAHQAIIDLEKNVLRIQGREVPFLPEHELPEHARNTYDPVELGDQEGAGPSSGSRQPGASTGSAGQQQKPQFPGGGQKLGAPPASNSARATPTVGGGQRLGGTPQPRQQTQPTSSFPEASINVLVEMGVSREEAIRLLEVAGGNVEVAASMLF